MAGRKTPSSAIAAAGDGVAQLFRNGTVEDDTSRRWAHIGQEQRS
jgi:hypothetical protein